MNENVTIDERYFAWLYEFVADPNCRNPSESYFLLCERLYKTPFEWSIRNDENRAHDGLELRDEFLRQLDETIPMDWYQLECSLFEMLIALSRRAAFQTGWSPDTWFWHILNNLELSRYTDEGYHSAIDDSVRRLLDRVLNRSYEADGRGGFFPLRDPGRDQRGVELWYQMSAYLLENIEF